MSGTTTSENIKMLQGRIVLPSPPPVPLHHHINQPLPPTPNHSFNQSNETSKERTEIKQEGQVKRKSLIFGTKKKKEEEFTITSPTFISSTSNVHLESTIIITQDTSPPTNNRSPPSPIPINGGLHKQSPLASSPSVSPPPTSPKPESDGRPPIPKRNNLVPSNNNNKPIIPPRNNISTINTPSPVCNDNNGFSEVTTSPTNTRPPLIIPRQNKLPPQIPSPTNSLPPTNPPPPIPTSHSNVNQPPPPRSKLRTNLIEKFEQPNNSPPTVEIIHPTLKRMSIHSTPTPPAISPRDTSPTYVPTPTDTSPDSASPDADVRRRTMRHNLLTRKSASMNLSADPDDEERGYESVSSYSLAPSSDSGSSDSTVSLVNLITSTSFASIYDDDADESSNVNNQPSPTTPTTVAAASKKKGFLFGSRKSNTAPINLVEINEMRDALLNRISNQDCSELGRRSRLPSFTADTPVHKVVNEILETEADYLDDLTIIINYYMGVLKELDETTPFNLVTLSEILLVFSNVEELYVINSKMFNMMVEIVPSISNQIYPNVEEVFFRHANSLKRYITYLSNQEAANKQISNWENNHQLNYILQQIKLIPQVKNLNLGSYVIKPVQRLCKYPLLLRELKKTVPEEDTHFRQYERAAKLMEKIVSEINGKIANEEKMAEIKEVIGKENESLLFKKTFIREGKLKLIKKEHGPSHDAHVYLLDDSIIIFRKKAFSKNSCLSIPFIHILGVQNIESRIKNGIDIIYIEKEGQQAFKLALSAENYFEKLIWLTEIEDSIHASKIFAESYYQISIHNSSTHDLSTENYHG